MFPPSSSPIVVAIFHSSPPPFSSRGLFKQEAIFGQISTHVSSDNKIILEVKLAKRH